MQQTESGLTSESLGESLELQRHHAAQAMLLGRAGCWTCPVGLLLLSTHLPAPERRAHPAAQGFLCLGAAVPQDTGGWCGKKDVKALSEVRL